MGRLLIGCAFLRSQSLTSGPAGNTTGIINKGTTGRHDKEARYRVVMLGKAGCFLRRAFLTTRSPRCRQGFR